jgi:hypothetical protein
MSIIKPTRCTNFSILFWNETLRVSDSSSVHRQDYFTVHTAMAYVIPVCGELASRIRMELQFRTSPERPRGRWLEINVCEITNYLHASVFDHLAK